MLIGALRLPLGRTCLLIGTLSLLIGDLRLLVSTPGVSRRKGTRDRRHQQQRGQDHHGQPRRAQRSAVQADLLGFQVTPFPPMKRRRELRDRVSKAAVAQIELGLRTRPTQVQISRFFPKDAA